MIDATLELTKTVNQGASATLPLVLSAPGLPSPTIQWLRDTSPISITQGGRYSVDSAGSLTIANVVPEDRGTYQVTVSNIGGDDTVNYTLLVNCKSLYNCYHVPCTLLLCNCYHVPCTLLLCKLFLTKPKAYIPYSG